MATAAAALPSNLMNIPCPMEEDKPLLLALVSGDIRDDEEFTDVTLA